MHRLLTFCLLVALTGLSATACTGGDDEPGASPAQVAERLQAAKRLLDQAGSIRLTLRTDRLPEGVNGITKAAGVATHAPAFRGTITVAASGLFDGQSVDVVAVDGRVYAQTPFSSSFIRVDPTDFNAPDPATLMQADRGSVDAAHGGDRPCRDRPASRRQGHRQHLHRLGARVGGRAHLPLRVGRPPVRRDVHDRPGRPPARRAGHRTVLPGTGRRSPTTSASSPPASRWRSAPRDVRLVTTPPALSALPAAGR